jgi:PAS domain-containing protein
MNPLLNPSHLMLLFGGCLLLLGVLIAVVFLIQKSVRSKLQLKEPIPAKVRVEDEAALTLATVNAVLKQLKADQKATQERLVVAERRAEENARKFELLAREVDFGLMVFDAEGYISFSNPMVRKVLAVDTWSRRRYGEIFRDIPVLSELIGMCFTGGTETRNQVVEFRPAEGSERRIEVSVLPTRDRTGALEVVACVFRELAFPAPGTDEFIGPAI